MWQCLSNFFGKDSSAAKQYHPYYELQIFKDKAKMCILFKSMKISKVKDIFEPDIAKFMSYYYLSKLPEKFDNCFKYVCSTVLFLFILV